MNSDLVPDIRQTGSVIHILQRITGRLPSLHATKKGKYIPETRLVHDERCTSARCFIRSGAVGNDQRFRIQPGCHFPDLRNLNG